MLDAVITRTLTVESTNSAWAHTEVTVDLPPPHRTATVTSALIWVRGSGKARASIAAYGYEIYDKYGQPTGQLAYHLRLEPPPINSEANWLRNAKNSITATGLRTITFELSAADMFACATFSIFLQEPPSIFRRAMTSLSRLLGIGGTELKPEP